MKKLLIPTNPPTEIQIPQDYPIPPVGSDFYIHYEQFVSPDDWPSVRSVLEDNVLTVANINGDSIHLQEGWDGEDGEDPVGIFLKYWENNPSTRPPGF